MRYRKNSYDLKIANQNRKHLQKRDRALDKQRNTDFHFHSSWNLNATGSIAIPFLLLINCIVITNAGIQAHSTNNNRIYTNSSVTTEICLDAPYNNINIGASDHGSKPFQLSSATILSTSKNLNVNDLNIYHAKPETIEVAEKKLAIKSSYNTLTVEPTELAANYKAISDLAQCYWNLNSTKVINEDRNCPKNVFKNIPDYEDLKIWGKWYKDVQFFPHGRSKDLLTAVIKHGRKEAPENTKVIILARSLEHYWYARDLINYCERFSILSNYKGKPIVGFYPEFFGTYIGNHFSVELFPLQYKHSIAIHTMHIAQNIKMSYLEMEYFDQILDHGVYNGQYPDSVVFERDISEWASRKIAKCVQGDNNLRHDVLVNVPYYRAYHIGDETYLFNPSPMPKMIDLDTLTCEDISERRYKSLYSSNQVLSQEAKKVVSEMEEKGIFDVFSLYFSKYKILNQNSIPNNAAVKHYYIPDEYLGRM
ncbi:MAG: hypothetical protein K0R73_1398 [Candidatus Midichloriaceae bacterium]|jgi:hypothetical protein|nr:hypothetical protein [Candidatus Midichloriaceae bacterium]